MEQQVTPSEVNEGLISTDRPNKIKMLVKFLFWSVVAVICLAFFTIAKLPDAKVRNVIQSYLSIELGRYGITLSAQETSFSLLFGCRYKMMKVRLYFPPPAKEILLDEIIVSPSFMTLLEGKLGGTLKIAQDKGAVTISAAGRKTSMDIGLDFDNFDLSKIQIGSIISLFTGSSGTNQMPGESEPLKLSGFVNGSGKVSIDTLDLKTLNGEIALSLKNISNEPQKLYGFLIPQMTVSEGQIGITAQKGKVDFKSVRLGKTGSATDDLQLTTSGNLTLEKTWRESKIALTLRFRFSEKSLKALPIPVRDGFLVGGKQSDGGYVFQLTGAAPYPEFMPVRP